MPFRYPLALLFALPVCAQLFQTTGVIPLGPDAIHVVADLNLDGRLDLAQTSAGTGQLTVSLGAADGSFGAPGTPIVVAAPNGLLQGDFDNDGRPDLVLLSGGLFSEPSLRVFPGSGTGTFTIGPAVRLQDATRTGGVADFDQDGNQDVLVFSTTPTGTSQLTLFKGNGRGELATSFFSAPVPVAVPAGTAAGDLQVVDLNGDRKPDVVMTVANASGAGLVVGIGDGRGAFTITVTIGSQAPLGAPLPRMGIGDFNLDRSLDVAMFGYQRDRVTLWTNSGGTLVPQISTSVPVGTNPYGIAVADFDLDGRMDWAVARQVATGTPELYVGLGNGAGLVTMAQGSPFAFGGASPTLVAGDFNGDRRQDVLVREGAGDAFRILLNAVQRPPTLTPQVIDFTQPGDRGLAEGSATLTAVSNSGLPVSLAGLTNPVCTVSKNVATFVTIGVCTVIAMQPGDSFYSPAPIVQRTFNITRNSQTITFDPLPDRPVDSVPFTVSATASSGLPVSFSAGPASVCTISGNRVALVAPGQCSVTATQAGNGTFPVAPPVTRTFTVTPVAIVGPRVESISNAASYAPGTLAPNSYGVLFGLRLTGATVRLRDTAGTTHALQIIFAGDTQINFIVPGAAALGAATVLVTTPNGASEFPVTIAATAPGLFSASGTGQGLAAAQALIVNNDKTITTLTVGDGPIPVRAGTEIYLVLYGTGIRGRSANGVFVTVAGGPVEVLYAGPQGTFPALDQLNVRVPLTLAGAGMVNIQLIVDGVVANIVTAEFR